MVAEWKNLAGKTSAPGSTTTIGSTNTPTTNPVRQAGGTVTLGGNGNSVGGTGVSAFGDTASANRTSSTAATATSMGSTLNSSSQNRHQHAEFLGEASSALPNLNEICRSAGLPIPG